MHDLPDLAPQPMKRTSRLPTRARKLAPGEYIDTDAKTGACIVSHGRYKGWQMVRRSSNGTTRVWRVS